MLALFIVCCFALDYNPSSLSSKKNYMAKTRIAVFFGGRSPEHDVSVLTALQVLGALPDTLYDTFPVYISLTGEWLVGDALRVAPSDRNTYIPGAEIRRGLTRVFLDLSNRGKGVLRPERPTLWGRRAIEFDVAIPAFHGAFGEDGCFQGLMEIAGIPYTGMRALGSAIAMDKTATKSLIQARTTVPQLPCITVQKHSERSLAAPVLPTDWQYPVIVKPAHLGSSIGVARANNSDTVRAQLQLISVHDTKALIEPFIERRREYNVSVRRSRDVVQLSAIEQPVFKADSPLDFDKKYKSGSGKKAGGNEGMASQDRKLNPPLDPELSENISRWAIDIFEALDGSGAPRLDFIFDEDTNKLYFNEINPCPGSFAFFLWEASSNNVLFAKLLQELVDEAMLLKEMGETPADPVPPGNRLFDRH